MPKHQQENERLEFYLRQAHLYAAPGGYEEDVKLFQELRDNRGRIRSAVAKEIAQHNLLLVVTIAIQYLNRGVDLDDLIQQGNLGLLKAVEKFDLSRGLKFSTYASWWIRQPILREISTRSKNLPYRLRGEC